MPSFTSFFYHLIEKIERSRRKADTEVFLERLSATKEDIILDVGAGTGWVADKVSDLCDEVYALEPNEKRLDFMKKKHPQVKGFSGSAENIAFPEGYFTKVFTLMAFHHFENQDSALDEFNRVLRKKDGILLVHEMDPKREGALETFEKKILRLRVHFIEPDKLKEKIEGHDFTVTEVTRMNRGYLLTAKISESP